MKRSVFNIVTAIIAVVYIGLLVVGNVFYASIPVETVPGSYAEQFANEHHLKQIHMPDSVRHLVDARYENIYFNTTSQGTLSAENYYGQSKDLTIPKYHQGITVTEIGEDFFSGTDLKSVYIPQTIDDIKAKPTKKVILYCDKDSGFYKKNKDSDEWKIETTYDSTYYNPTCADIPFLYNDNGNSIEIAGYTGNDEYLGIPAYIDGKPVTKVSCDLFGRYKVVYFPDTVQEITGRVSAWSFSPVLVVEVIFTVLAFVIVIANVNIILPRFAKDLNEHMLSGSQIVLSGLYLVAQVYLSFRYIYIVRIPAVLAALISLAVMLAYVVAISLLNRGREHSIKVTQQVKEQTAPVRNLQSMVKGLSDGIKDSETKKAVSRMIDEIRFTQAKSKNREVEDLVADKIMLLKTIISEGNNEEIIAKCNEIVDLMKNR